MGNLSNAAMTTHPSPSSINRRRFLAASAALGMAIGAPLDALAATCRKPSDRWIPSDDFLAELPRIMQAFAVPGVGIAVVEEGEVVWSRPFGVTHRSRGKPVDARTIFEDASLSKPVFAYLVLQLVDQGLIDLDRPLVEYRRTDYLAAPSLDRKNHHARRAASFHRPAQLAQVAGDGEAGADGRTGHAHRLFRRSHFLAAAGSGNHHRPEPGRIDAGPSVRAGRDEGQQLYLECGPGGTFSVWASRA